jgi:molybdopterin converting factor small subunit
MAVTVKVKYTSIFREITRRAEEIIRMENPVARELIAFLCRVYGRRFRELVIDPQSGEICLTGGVFISRNGYRLNMSDPIADGDEITFLLAIHE